VLQQGAEGGGQGDGTYKGMTGYTDYRAGFRREQTVRGAGARLVRFFCPEG
jgi:hypothetical protein